MRVGCVYARRQNWPKWDWVRNALIRLGHEVIRVHDAKQLVAADELCELMLFEHRDGGIGWRNIRDIAPTRKAKWAQWWFDLFGWDDRSLAEMLGRYGSTQKLFDRVYVKERSCIDLYRENGVRAVYLDQGIPSDWPEAEHRDSPEWDVLVFGKASPDHRNRINATKAIVKAGMRVAWASMDGVVPSGVERLEWCPPKLLPSLIGRAKCVLCVNFRDDVDGYWSDRTLMVKGAGAIPVTNAEEAVVACAMTAGERRDMGHTLRRHVMEHHTYENRLTDIIADYGRGFANAPVVPTLPGEEKTAATGV